MSIKMKAFWQAEMWTKMFCEKEKFLLLFAKIQVFFSKVRNQKKLKFLQNYPDRRKACMYICPSSKSRVTRCSSACHATDFGIFPSFSPNDLSILFTQYGNLRIFLSLWFYVKSMLVNSESQKLPTKQLWLLWILILVNFDISISV